MKDLQHSLPNHQNLIALETNKREIRLILVTIHVLNIENKDHLYFNHFLMKICLINQNLINNLNFLI